MRMRMGVGMRMRMRMRMRRMRRKEEMVECGEREGDVRRCVWRGRRVSTERERDGEIDRS
eukprot:1417015-Rhodomonas_salina.3